MGIEFIGLNPSGEVGESFGSSYFRMNPLLFLVDDLMEDERVVLKDDERMDAEAARKLGEKLDKLLDGGAYEAYMAAGKHEFLMRQFLERLRDKFEAPEEIPEAQKPRGRIRALVGRLLPHRFQKKQTRMWDEMPEAPTKHRVRWFAAFLRSSGGFRISY
jgi:hypothetical protein